MDTSPEKPLRPILRSHEFKLACYDGEIVKWLEVPPGQPNLIKKVNFFFKIKRIVTVNNLFIITFSVSYQIVTLSVVSKIVCLTD